LPAPPEPDAQAAAPAGAYPRFSDAEMARRWGGASAELERAGADALLLYGADRTGAAVQWLTHWPVTREAVLVWDPEEGPPLLFVQFANHLDNASRIATGCEVRWGGDDTIVAAAEELRARRRAPFRLAVVGPLPARSLPALEAAGAEVVFCDQAFQRLRLIKSDQELEWVRRGAALTDAGVAELARAAGPGTSEAELAALVESAYVPYGATTHIHYFSVTSMHGPSMGVPAQWPSDRVLASGDAVSCEVSASWWGYPGQLLRSFSVGETPTPLYRDLYDVASRAFEAIAGKVAPGTTAAELADEARLIASAGYSTCDDLVHGFVGGYLPPVVPGAGRPARDGSFVLEEGMTVVVQPNVVTPDGSAGVQTGELLLVTATGHERLHAYPREMAVLAR
jgi:Xaa-Pro dipeptidase